MKLHEYQAKALFEDYGIPAPDGIVAHTPKDAARAAQRLGLPVAIKAQVQAGGRGKAGGVALVGDAAQVAAEAEKIFALTIGGFPVRRVLVTQAVSIEKDLYLSLLIDRDARRAAFVGCAEGGVEIETAAKESPDRILRCEVPVCQLADVPRQLLVEFSRRLCSDRQLGAQVVDIMVRMGKLFTNTDASLIEINPLAVDSTGSLVALDAKMVLDDNALFRHPDLLRLRDDDSDDLDGLDTRRAGLSFVRLEGNIGCVVNGAGLAMATMDVIKRFGGEPANFLDVGGGAGRRAVPAAFEAILNDSRVKAVLVNIFGGITRCDEVARGILDALEQFDVAVPVVVRLTGTNETEGHALLEGAGLIFAETLEEAAARAVEIGGSS